MRAISPAVLTLATVTAVAGGVILLLRDSSGGRIEITLPTATPTAEATLKVYVSGVVRAPDVYALNQGDRLADVIAATGGST